MAGGANLDDDEGIVGINVTPLVDVMLVLLIIFMVASTYIVKNSIEVDRSRRGEVLTHPVDRDRKVWQAVSQWGTE